jgi:ABC-type dipeptide/oligopeptide/nickel transport system ATPase component
VAARLFAGRAAAAVCAERLRGSVPREDSLLISDEPTTALDVTVRAEILALLARLRTDLGMEIILSTHDTGFIVDVCEP